MIMEYNVCGMLNNVQKDECFIRIMSYHKKNKRWCYNKLFHEFLRLRT